MRILLVQLPTSHFGARERVYPLGLSRLARCLPRRAEASFLDMNLASDPWPALKDRLDSFAPDTVALSFRNLDPLAGQQTSYVSCLVTAAQMVRRLAPECRVLAGGPAFSLFAERLMALAPQLDAGIVGEGETAFAQWLAAPWRTDLKGLTARTGIGTRYTPNDRYVSMDDLPLPDTDAFPVKPYLEHNRYVAAVGVEGKRGCDLACAYCVYPQISGRRLRLRSPKAVADEMAYLNSVSGVTLFHFTDSVVNQPVDHFEAVCREIIRRNLKVRWAGFFREEGVTGALLALACKAGLCAVYFSGDALTDFGLKLLNKRMTMDTLFRAARLSADNGIVTMCHFLVNLPGEQPVHFCQSRENLDRLLSIHAAAGNLGAVVFNTIRLYPGAPLTGKLIRDRLLSPETDLLYPVYHNPLASAHILHELEALSHTAGVFSRLNLPRPEQKVAT